MPFRSEAQRRFMYATDPKMAKRFEKKTKKKNLPEKVAVKKQDLPDLPDWAKDLFDRKGNLKNYLPSLDEEPKEIPTPPLHPGETSLDIDEHRERGDFDVESLGEQYYPSQYNQQMNLPYGYEREMTVDEVIDSHPMLRNAPRDFAEEYVKQHQFSPYRHLNTKDSRKSPFQLNLQRLTEFEDYDDWNEFDKNDDVTGHAFDLPSFLNIPWNEKTAFTRSEPMDLAWRLLKRETHPGESIAHFMGYDSDFDDQGRLHLDRGEGPLIHYNPETGEGRGQLNPNARLYHPAIHPSHADENMFPDRKIVTRPDGTKEELVASSKYVLEDTKPVFDELGQLSYVETTPMPTFQNIPFSEETGFTKALQMLRGDM